MSAAEIIFELPKLSSAELLTVRRKLVEIADENGEIAACDEAALEGALLLERLEADQDAR